MSSPRIEWSCSECQSVITDQRSIVLFVTQYYDGHVMVQEDLTYTLIIIIYETLSI
jgi:hypothetical protein